MRRVGAVPRARGGGERGSLAVEFALLGPVLVLFVFGIIEMGLAWQDRMVVQTAVRSGARVGSALGTQPTADRDLLLNLGSSLTGAGLAGVDWVVVYKPSDAAGTMPGACRSPGPQSVAGSCNAYTGAQLASVVNGTAPAGWFGCGGASLDRYWCPASRQDNQILGTDHLGVWVSARHDMLTGLFGTQLTVRDNAVMRLEPGG